MTGKFIAIGNLKGGTGKTTLAINLSAELANRANSSVMLVDADSQGSAAAWLSLKGETGLECTAMPLESTGRANSWLNRVRKLADDYSYVVIDLPANVGAATQAALAGADLVVVPVTPSPVDFHAAMQVIKLLRGARKARGNDEPACLLVGSKVDRRTVVGRGIEIALKEFGEPVGPAICQRAAFVSSAVRGGWVGAFEADSPAREEIATLARRVRRLVKSTESSGGRNQGSAESDQRMSRRSSAA